MQEIIIDNSVTNYDECYLRAMELANDYLKNLNKPNTEYWLYKEIKGAVEYYHKKLWNKILNLFQNGNSWRGRYDRT